ncbi:MAG: hypothetical protein ACFCBW_19030 [Candidatus Competibacterales bacterium]
MVNQRITYFIAAFFFIFFIPFLTYFLYYPGITGRFIFDDIPNLEPLTRIVDINSYQTILFVFDGHSSIFGRPLSLASFLINKDSWPNNPSDFIHVNILLHCLNSILFFYFCYIISGFFHYPKNQTINDIKKRLFFSFVATLVWCLNPLLATSTLLVIQRMTLLSGLFTILALIFYTKARKTLNEKPYRSYIYMICALFTCGLLGLLSKENIIVLTFYIFLLETLIFNLKDQPTKRIQKTHTTWVTLLFMIPVIIMATYLYVGYQGIINGYSIRDFNLYERLITQTVVLKDYLFSAFVPQASKFGIFHDDYPIYSSIYNSDVLLSIIFWFFLITLAIFLIKTLPMLLLAVFWFLLGHSLESTFIPLELYFEHRNYTPLMGFCLFGSFLFNHFLQSKKKIYYCFLIGYIGLIAITLHQITSLWGNPPVAAAYWATLSPGSARATIFDIQMTLRQGNTLEAIRKVDEFYERSPEHPVALANKIFVHCIAKNKFEADKLTYHKLETMSHSFGVAEVVKALFVAATEDDCPIEEDDILKMINAIFNNKNYENSPAQFSLFYTKHEIYRNKKDFHNTMKNLEAAFKKNPDLHLLIRIVHTFQSAGLYEEAIQFIDESVEDHIPINPLLAHVWHTTALRMKKQMEYLLNITHSRSSQQPE